jgi:hypothetical protein
MTIDEQIKILESNSEFERKEGDLQGCLNFKQLAEWLKELKTHREAWDGMKDGLLEMSRLHEYVSIKCVISLIDGFRPKEDAE